MEFLHYSFDWTAALLVLAVGVALVHVVPWLFDPHGIRSYPGPLLAKFSDAWLGWVAAQGHRSEVVHELHKKYGECSQVLFSLLGQAYGHTRAVLSLLSLPRHALVLRSIAKSRRVKV